MPSLNLAIARLVNAGTDNFAIWVVKSPYPSGHVIHDCIWSPEMEQTWREWQEWFANHSNLGMLPPRDVNPPKPVAEPSAAVGSPQSNYAGRLMQLFGNQLWQWVFDGPILSSLERSRGIAMGQESRLRVCLELRDPSLVAIPWEIMQNPGQSAISLGQQMLFSRTTSDVEPLPELETDPGLNILLVLGEDENLNLDAEADLLEKTLTDGSRMGSSTYGYAPCFVHHLIQPSREKLIAELESNNYNVLFYAGHGSRAANGGVLFLSPGETMSGIELAQVLTRTGVKLAVFNSCWGAQPATINHQSIPYSSLAEVLIRHGVPAVLGMRDEIANAESLCFIQAFAQALRSRKPIDEATAEARRQLLTIYRFNQPAWTLPVLYQHPEFNSQILRSLDETVTELPSNLLSEYQLPPPNAILRSLSADNKVWQLKGRTTHIGRVPENDIVIPDLSVSRHHAKIVCRDTFSDTTFVQTYYLIDDSTYGTYISHPGSIGAWQRIHQTEIKIESGMQLKFGSPRSDGWEFIVGKV